MSTNLNRKNKIVALAPGRICLFGDHQDYLGLPVIACAIDRSIKLTAVQNSTNIFKLYMEDINEIRSIDIKESFLVLEPRDYFASALRVLKRHGCIPTVGYDIHIKGTIPINSGTSSSSAVLIAWIKFLVEAFGVENTVTPEFISKIAYTSEVLEHNEPGGMMDQYCIGIGNILHIKTSEPYVCDVIGTQMKGLISGVSGIPKETIEVLGDLKGNALLAIDIIREKFPDFDLYKTEVKDLKKYIVFLPEKLVPFFEAAIKNHQYTKEALEEFKKPTLDLKKIGDLMNGHHDVLKNLLKITVPKIDDMIDAALLAGAYGAKIVGSGGGGSIVVIAEPSHERLIVEAILRAGAKEAYGVSVAAGARIV